MVGFGPVVLAANALAILVGYATGTSIGTEPAAELEIAREVAAVLWCIVFVVTALRTVGTYATIDGRALLYTTVPRRAILVGVVLSQFALLSVAVGVPIVVGAAAVAVGSGNVLAFPVISVVGACLLTVAHLVGFAAGALTLAIARSVPVAPKYRDVLVWLPFVVLLGIQLLDSEGRVMGALSAALVRTPLGAYGDLAFVWTDAPVEPTSIAILLVVSMAALGGSFVVASSVAHAVWREPDGAGGVDSQRRLIASVPVGDRRLAAVTTTAIRRAIRAPRTIIYLVVPILLFLEPIARILRTGAVDSTDPGLVLLYGTWATGVAYSLDPIGSEGPVLPMTLTTGVRGETIVDGRTIAGIVTVGPGAVGLCLLVGIVSPLSSWETIVVAGTAAVTCVSAPSIAAAIGVTFPGRTTSRLPGDRTIPTPNKLAFALFSLMTVLITGPLLSALLVDAISLVLGSAMTCAVAICCAGIARRYAARRIGQYRL